MNFTPIGGAGQVECFAVIKNCDKKTAKNGSTYLDLTLCDKDGEISAKLWDYSEISHSQFTANSFVKVRGTLSKYNGNDQLRVERIRFVNENDGVKLDDYVKSAEYSGEDMLSALISTVEKFSDSHLRQLVLTLLSENREQLLYFPAAFRLHHAIRGGLLMHTSSIVKLCEGVCKVYPFVDRELLISGAILHDIAKIAEFSVSETGLASGYTVEGNLIGHLVKGAMMIEKTAEKLSINSEKVMLLEHMVLSHHGVPDYGAAVRPQFLEAELLSELDLMDARIYEIMSAVEGLETGEFSQRLWALEDRKFYRHNNASLKVDLL